MKTRKDFQFLSRSVLYLIYVNRSEKEFNVSDVHTMSSSRGAMQIKRAYFDHRNPDILLFLFNRIVFCCCKICFGFLSLFFRRLRDERINIFRRSLHRCSLFWLINLSREPDIVSKLHFFAVFSFCYWSEFSLIFFLVGGRYLEEEKKRFTFQRLCNCRCVSLSVGVGKHETGQDAFQIVVISWNVIITSIVNSSWIVKYSIIMNFFIFYPQSDEIVNIVHSCSRVNIFNEFLNFQFVFGL